MHKQRVVATLVTEIVIQFYKPLERLFRYHFFKRIERQGNVSFSGRDNRHNIGKISCVCAPTFRALLIGENFYEREVFNRCRVPAHFEPVVEKVVLLVCFERAFLDFFQFEIVTALFTYFGYKHNPKLETAVVDIVRNDLSPKT